MNISYINQHHLHTVKLVYKPHEYYSYLSYLRSLFELCGPPKVDRSFEGLTLYRDFCWVYDQQWRSSDLQQIGN